MEIECFLTGAPATHILRQSLFRNPNQRRNKNGILKVSAKTNHQDNDHDHPFFQSAISHASYRFQETLRSEPLFVDTYAGCFVPSNLGVAKNLEQQDKLQYYCVGTRFIDDQLLSAIKGVDGAKQVVLFTDGMDTRAYRLNWPSSTVIYDVSPQAVFKKASQKLQDVHILGHNNLIHAHDCSSSSGSTSFQALGTSSHKLIDVGAKIPRGCLIYHVPLESSDIQQLLRDKGFNGCRPSIWVFQGFPVTNLTAFKEILFMASNLAMKGCLFLGEFPLWLTETVVGIKPTEEMWMDELFMSYGFRVRIIGYDEVARNLGQEQLEGECNSLLFVAEHLRFSDDEMEVWRREFQRVEEEGDEDGFEEL